MAVKLAQVAVVSLDSVSSDTRETIRPQTCISNHHKGFMSDPRPNHTCLPQRWIVAELSKPCKCMCVCESECTRCSFIRFLIFWCQHLLRNQQNHCTTIVTTVCFCDYVCKYNTMHLLMYTAETTTTYSEKQQERKLKQKLITIVHCKMFTIIVFEIRATRYVFR